MDRALKTINEETIRAYAKELWSRVPGNILSEDMGIDPRYSGIRMYDAPLVGFGSANDPLFQTYKAPDVIGPWHMSPNEWLPEAQTVISFFFPTSEEIRKSNRQEEQIASTLWAYARIEGQNYILAYTEAMAAWFREWGYEACVPSADPRWQQLTAGKGIEGYSEIQEDSFGSRWSERHAAYVCAMGTFGLSKGFITENGMAGRFGSVLVSAALEPDPRPFTGIYDNCIHCLACVRRCPAKAIDPIHGKNHMICGAHVTASRAVHAPRYGCGLCQTGVPCESQNPIRLKKA